MRVFLHYEEGADEAHHMTLKLTLPSKWKTGPTKKLKDTFVEHYNKKHAATEGAPTLSSATSHLAGADGVGFPDAGAVDRFIKSNDDVYIRPGPSPEAKDDDDEPAVHTTGAAAAGAGAGSAAAAPRCPPAAAAGTSAKPGADGRLQCRRFGCQKKFHARDNSDTACRYHVKPPVFHETRKYWACCPRKIAYDWETFMAIPGCQIGRHSTESQTKKAMGGCDVRAEKYEYAPKRIDGGGAKKKKEKTGLEKLMALRKALVAAGVEGKAFDAARDKLKAEHEALGKKVWDKVAEELAKGISAHLKAQS